MATPYPTPLDERRAGFRVISDEDAPTYDGEAQRAQQRYTRVPELVRAMNDGYALAVFEAIARNDNGSRESWPSIKTICERVGWSKKVVLPAIQRLIEVGALVKEARKLNGMDQSNKYRITAYDQVVPTAPPVVPTVTLGGSHGDSGCHPQNHKEEPVELKPKEQERVKPPTPKPDDRFELDFWRSYPKGRGSKQDAARLWARLSDEDRAAAIDALPVFAAGRDWKRGFHPAPEVWLRGRRWENPPPPDIGEANGHSNGKPRGMTPEEIRAYGRGEYGHEQERDGADFIDVRGSLVK